MKVLYFNLSSDGHNFTHKLLQWLQRFRIWAADKKVVISISPQLFVRSLSKMLDEFTRMKS